MDNMANYDKMYSLLFNAITDALGKLEKQNLGDAKDILISAQQKGTFSHVREGPLLSALPCLQGEHFNDYFLKLSLSVTDRLNTR